LLGKPLALTGKQQRAMKLNSADSAHASKSSWSERSVRKMMAS
jgi:hypothetical protein